MSDPKVFDFFYTEKEMLELLNQVDAEFGIKYYDKTEAIRRLIEKFFEWREKTRELDKIPDGNEWRYKMAEIAMEIRDFGKEDADE